MKYIVHQIHLTKEQQNAVEDYAEKHNNYPDFYKAYLDTKFDTERKPQAQAVREAWKMYEPVATVDAQHCEQAFVKGNNGLMFPIDGKQPHSISVGDILEDENGIFRVCSSVGFMKVEVGE